ncbi:hypothetical protein AX16_003314 [Volvariella volvacea WC 439]|nr:hypothetical protein AX16_003314 [Volvariella volvacea WC 439]
MRAVGIKSFLNGSHTPKNGAPTSDTDRLRTRLAHHMLVIASAPIGIIIRPLNSGPVSKSDLEKGLDIACKIVGLVATGAGVIPVPGVKELVEALHKILQNAQDVQSTRSEYEDLVQRACSLVYEIFNEVKDNYNHLTLTAQHALQRLLSAFKEIQAKSSRQIKANSISITFTPAHHAAII